MSHPSSLALHGLAEGTLPVSEATSVREHVAGCARCREELAGLAASREHFTRDVYARTVSALHGRVAARRAVFALPRFSRAWVGFGGVAAAVLVLFVFFPRGGTPLKTDPVPVYGFKGGVTLEVFAKRAGRVIPVKEGAHLSPGDELRFAVQGPRPRELLLVSVDGARHVSVYHPFDGTRSAPLATGARVELLDSVVLDAAPGPERVFAFFSEQPLELADVRGPLQALADAGPERIRAVTHLEVPARVGAQTSFLFERGPR